MDNKQLIEHFSDTKNRVLFKKGGEILKKEAKIFVTTNYTQYPRVKRFKKSQRPRPIHISPRNMSNLFKVNGQKV